MKPLDKKPNMCIRGTEQGKGNRTLFFPWKQTRRPEGREVSYLAGEFFCLRGGEGH